MVWNKEKAVRTLIREHIELINNVISSMIDTVSSYIKGDLDNTKEKSFQTHSSQSEADNKRREIITMLNNGAFFPNLRSDLAGFISSLGNIADQSEYCCDILIYEKPELSDFVSKQLTDINIKTKNAFNSLTAAVSDLTHNTSRVLENIERVRTAEKEIDKAEWNTISRLFGDEKTFEKKSQLSSLVRNITKVSDLIEDTADYLEVISLRLSL